MEELDDRNTNELNNNIICNNHNNKNIIPKKNKYTIKQKLGVVKDSYLTSIHAVSAKYGIDSLLFVIGLNKKIF